MSIFSEDLIIKEIHIEVHTGEMIQHFKRTSPKKKKKKKKKKGPRQIKKKKKKGKVTCVEVG